MNGNVDIGKDTSMKGNLIVSGSETTLLNSNKTVIGNDYTSDFIVNSTSNFTNLVMMTDMSASKMVTSANISSAYIYSLPNNNNNTLTIGENARNIVIGGPNSQISYYNNNIPITYHGITSMADTSSSFITLNSNTTIPDIGNSGINIYKPATTSTTATAYSAFFLVSKDEKQVKFKAPSSRNVVSINLHDLSKNLSTNNNGILVLNKYNESDIQDISNLSITHQINVSSFDISNILQRSMSESNAKKQVVTTDLSVKGNLIINSSITSTTSALDVSGNFVHSNGWIKQF
jgi:hypothetical protein